MTANVNREGKLLLVLNGELPSRACIAEARAESDHFLCTDGAADGLLALNLPPQVVIGDLDSLTEETRGALAETTHIIERPSQYASDFQKALQYAEDEGWREIILLGMKGRRMDHAFTNMSILAENGSRFSFTVRDDDGKGILLNEMRNRYCGKEKIGTGVSLLPLPHVEGVRTEGLLYPLAKEPLTFAGRSGQSNENNHERFSIEIAEGQLFVFILAEGRPQPQASPS
ncbi:thiamine diphosphokinase [bacterium]|nr:thiamine diphosphokinase [bacterium]